MQQLCDGVQSVSAVILRHVWESSQQSGAPFVVLLALADSADDDGAACHSIESLAKKARLGTRATQYAIGELVRAGEVVVERGGGRQRSHRYVVTAPERVQTVHPFPDEESERVQTVHPLDPERVHGLHPLASADPERVHGLHPLASTGPMPPAGKGARFAPFPGRPSRVRTHAPASAPRRMRRRTGPDACVGAESYCSNSLVTPGRTKEEVTTGSTQGEEIATPVPGTQLSGEHDSHSFHMSDISEKAADPRIDEVWDYYRERVFPGARTCARSKISARLKRFTVDELKRGIDNFAASEWSMRRNANRGCAWFFHSDARSEMYLHMRPDADRQNGRSGDAHLQSSAHRVESEAFDI